MKHRPVLLDETIRWLNPQPGQRFCDMTVGGGGHTRALLQAVGTAGCVFGIDRDGELLRETTQELRNEGYGEERFQAVAGNFGDIDVLLGAARLGEFDGFVADLGAASPHLDRPERGFSFREPGPLDMRFDRSGGPTLKEALQALDEASVRRAIWEYGEDRFASRIARAIVEARDAGRLTDTQALADVIRGAYPARARHASRIDPATRAFQALRIVVNAELESVERGLRAVLDGMKAGSRLVVISFHSLEDRIVKRLFRAASEGVQNLYGHRSAAPARELFRRPVTPGEMEIAGNPRARSAKLRALEKLADGKIDVSRV